jgi:hypothetical protein
MIRGVERKETIEGQLSEFNRKASTTIDLTAEGRRKMERE